MELRQTRRDFLASASLAAAAGVLGAQGSLAGEGAPEVTALRLPSDPNICLAPADIAENLLRAEGFTDVRYVPVSGGFTQPHRAARGEIDFGFTFAASVVFQQDAGVPVTALAGVHSGCYELFAHDPVRTIRDLKGRSVGIQTLSSSGHLYVAIMAAHVGLDPHEDINWVTSPTGNAMELFAEGKVDAFLGFPPEPQELRARKIGRVILSTATDQPWSQYFCCMAFGNREFVRAYPVATKRFLRAIFKAADLCVAEPERVAQQLVDAGFTRHYGYALQALTDIPYDRWREFDPEDALRFYAHRLHEVGMIKSSPNAIIAEGTDWRFLDELKRELKA
ncbi:MAG: ABC-type nitrate/sulfonate/bicarbonate transport system [Geminicoccaceae bacterium]|jgi:NitT/TauT family transport system substrate-binding protein|nr:ABC-type nitrate/sulfonate/bicarbonate transport system [Geminicoccaceae bacterium]